MSDTDYILVPACPACKSLSVNFHIEGLEDGPEQCAQCEKCGWEGFEFEVSTRWIKANWPRPTIHSEGDDELYPGEYRGRP